MSHLLNISLASDEVFELSKTKYYDLKKLLEGEGPEVFDVLSGKKIPLSIRRQLAAKGCNISLDGDELVINDQRISVGNTVPREMVEAMHAALSERDAREEQKDVQIKAQSAKLEKVQGDYVELLEEVNELRSMDDLFAELATVVKLLGYGLRDMDEDERRERAVVDLPLLAEQVDLICAAYGTIGLEFAAWKEKADEGWQTLLAEKLGSEAAVVTDEDNF